MSSKAGVLKYLNAKINILLIKWLSFYFSVYIYKDIIFLFTIVTVGIKFFNEFSLMLNNFFFIRHCYEKKLFDLLGLRTIIRGYFRIWILGLNNSLGFWGFKVWFVYLKDLFNYIENREFKGPKQRKYLQQYFRCGLEIIKVCNDVMMVGMGKKYDFPEILRI